MLKEFLRIFAFVLLLIVIIADDFPFYDKMKNSITQLFLAIVIILMIFYDPLFGFIMGLVIMLIYYEIYKKIKKIKSVEVKDQSSNAEEYQPIMMDYITDEHLHSAQNNIVDVDNFNTEVKGLQNGFNNEGLYGAQGIDKQKLNFGGYDQDDKYFSYE